MLRTLVPGGLRSDWLGGFVTRTEGRGLTRDLALAWFGSAVAGEIVGVPGLAPDAGIIAQRRVWPAQRLGPCRLYILYIMYILFD
jgi:hypothetical protein